MRLFFALLPDATASKRLAELAASLERGTSLSLVPLENFHVTLAFIGDIQQAVVPSIRRLGAATIASGGVVSFSICEFWPHSRVVVVTGNAIAPGLVVLAERLQWVVAPHRARRVGEPTWRPHVTVARKVLQAPVLQALSPITWMARSFSLMRSERRDGRSFYTVVDTYPLLDKI